LVKLLRVWDLDSGVQPENATVVVDAIYSFWCKQMKQYIIYSFCWCQ